MSENSTHTQSHIDSIARQEHEFLEQRTLSERVGDRPEGEPNWERRKQLRHIHAPAVVY